MQLLPIAHNLFSQTYNSYPVALYIDFQVYTLHFIFEAGTSRGTMTEKETVFLRIFDDLHPEKIGKGECSLLKKLSPDDVPDYLQHLRHFCEQFNNLYLNPSAIEEALQVVYQLIPPAFPSIIFGFETALYDYSRGGTQLLFPSDFTEGIRPVPINGLIWMGSPAFMKRQIDEKLAAGYTTLKLKIGAIDFAQECALLAYIRSQYGADKITLRVDANGAFKPEEALHKLQTLAAFELHSIEQPIAAGNWLANRELCVNSPVPVALDEELIGVMQREEKIRLLDTILPPYIILKPSLLGGFHHCCEWIELAEARQIKWWMTSALESNIGLNAIAQFTATLNNPLPQGLGTGQLYHNNVPSALYIEQGWLWMGKCVD